MVFAAIQGRVRAMGNRAWIQVDFGESQRMTLSAVALRHGGLADIAAVRITLLCCDAEP